MNTKTPTTTSAPYVASPSAMSQSALVAAYVDLVDVRLSSLSSRVQIHPDDIVKDETVTWSIGEPTHEYVFHEMDRLLQIIVGVRVAAERKVEQLSRGRRLARSANEALLEISVSCVLDYKLNVEAPPEDVQDELFTAFGAVNGVYNGWPYLREVVQTTASRMGIPSVVMPVFRLPPPRRTPADPILTSQAGSPPPVPVASVVGTDPASNVRNR